MLMVTDAFAVNTQFAVLQTRQSAMQSLVGDWPQAILPSCAEAQVKLREAVLGMLVCEKLASVMGCLMHQAIQMHQDIRTDPVCILVFCRLYTQMCVILSLSCIEGRLSLSGADVTLHCRSE